MMATNGNLVDFYRVFVIPDFWFDLNGVMLTGGPKNPGQDFLPFYYGNNEADFKPQIELIVDGESAGVGGTVDEDIQRVNFGTVQKPVWAHAAGFWFSHETFKNGQHTVQLHALLELNRFVGDFVFDRGYVDTIQGPHEFFTRHLRSSFT